MRLIFATLLLISSILCVPGVFAGTAASVHAIAIHGSPKYGPDFQHFDYINPQAPGSTDEARLQNPIDQLQMREVAQISILGKQEELILSSNPRRVGNRLAVSKNEFLIPRKIDAGETLISNKINVSYQRKADRSKV